MDRERIAEPGDAVDAVVFDVGGVLVRLGGVERMVHHSGLASAAAVWERWLACPWVRDFERGRCSADAFAAGVVTTWELDIEPGRFLDEFATWPEGPLPGARDLVAEVAATVPVAVLANTNAVHWRRAEAWGFADRCAHRFLSHELGMVKPDAEIFDHAAAVLSLPPGRILFLDDLATNVEAARRRGFQARRVEGPAEARAQLVRTGLLTG